jgi:dipeptidyl aminopeptidase/acylaminoacyl peptidase
VERFARLWHFDIETKKQTIVFDGDLLIEEFDVSRDGKRIVFAGLPDDRVNYVHNAELYLINVDGTGFKRLTHNKVPEAQPYWSPDNKTILFHANYEEPNEDKWTLRVGSFWLLNTETGEFRRLQSQKDGETYGEKAWSPDGKYFYFNEVHGTNTNLYRIDVEQDILEPMTEVAGCVDPRSYSADLTKVAYIFQDHNMPPDLYVSDLPMEHPVRMTDINPWIKKEIQLSKGESVRWKSSKGNLEIEGMFYKPYNSNPDKKDPLIVHIHGGPPGIVDNSFRPEFHVFGGLGYAILGPNFRGSTGYGDQFLLALTGEVGDGEHADVMSGVDYVIEHNNIDPDKMAVRGWSWGGVSTGHLVTHEHRFKAARAGAGVFDWAAEVGPGFTFDVSNWYIGGTPWDNPEEWQKRSAVTHARNVKTPLLIVHGGADTTSSVHQSLIYFTALRDVGNIPVRYIKLPRQGHDIEEPRLRRVALVEEIRWFEKYVKGVEWNPPQRETQ